MKARILVTMLSIATTFVANAVILHTDGVVKVKGGSWKDVVITVVPEFSEPFEIALSGAHFKLDLPLHATYLLRAEHPGCPAKSILFDCTIPETLNSTEYEFPFEVQLELFEAQEAFVYAGPIGLVSFDPDQRDFTFSTDYSRIHSVTVLPELEKIMSSRIASRGAQHEIKEEAVLERSEETVLNVDLPNAKEVTMEMDSSGLAVQPEDHISSQILMVSVNEEADPQSDPNVIAERRENIPSSTNATIIHSAKRTANISDRTRIEPAQCNTHDFIEASRYFVVIDRIGSGDGCMELRRVTHAFGATYYFINGIATTEERYSNAFQPVPPTKDSRIYVQN